MNVSRLAPLILMLVIHGCTAELADIDAASNSDPYQSGSCGVFEKPAVDHKDWGYFAPGSNVSYVMHCPKDRDLPCTEHYTAKVELKTPAGEPIKDAHVTLNLAAGDDCGFITRTSLTGGVQLDSWGAGTLPLNQPYAYTGRGDAASAKHFYLQIEFPRQDCRRCIYPYEIVAERYLPLDGPVWQKTFNLGVRR